MSFDQINLIVGATVAFLVVAAFVLGYYRGRRKPEFPTISAQPPITASIVEPIVQAPELNTWVLEVEGKVKFDTKVEWSDKAVHIITGTAPKSFEFKKSPGVVPVHTTGIPPDWADEGISYQWRAKPTHWS